MERSWIEERALHRQWLTELNMAELLDVAEDIKARLDYEATYQEQIQIARDLMNKAVS